MENCIDDAFVLGVLANTNTLPCHYFDPSRGRYLGVGDGGGGW